jgi:inactivated superfamily I helicase
VKSMSMSEQQRATWLDGSLWERFERLETRHRRVQWEHRLARQDLQRLPSTEAELLDEAWQRYCDVISELDRATAAIELLRTCVTRNPRVAP